MITVASGTDNIDGSKYSVYKNPSTGLYYRLHIKTVGVSGVEKYRCQAVVNELIQQFYLALYLLGRCAK